MRRGLEERRFGREAVPYRRLPYAPRLMDALERQANSAGGMRLHPDIQRKMVTQEFWLLASIWLLACGGWGGGAGNRFLGDVQSDTFEGGNSPVFSRPGLNSWNPASSAAAETRGWSRLLRRTSSATTTKPWLILRERDDLDQGKYVCPVDGRPRIRQGDAVATSGGRFDSSRGVGRQHGALDLNSVVGAAARAVRSGQIAVSEDAWGAMGNTVIVDHGDGEYSVYGHLDARTVHEGDEVSGGTQIGSVGYTGNAAALKEVGLSPHLHFALIRAGRLGLAGAGQPLRRMRSWGDYWQALGAEFTGPVNPGLVMGSSCWEGSTTVGAPGER